MTVKFLAFLIDHMRPLLSGCFNDSLMCEAQLKPLQPVKSERPVELSVWEGKATGDTESNGVNFRVRVCMSKRKSEEMMVSNSKKWWERW